ncbi:MAG TPA: M23 family metallopeptidase, partial [Flavobacteriaceae bacterium]|nr:M23 family metallopeptidase [Flavobacteriaceae bacterium]
RTATDLVYKTDSLEQVIKLNNIYIDKIQQVLSGEVEKIEYNEDSILSAFEIDKDTLNLMPSEKDLEFRDEIEAIDRFSIFSEATKSTEIVFFTPVTGTITDGFNPDKKHFAVDLAVEMGTPVKAVADGTVIFAEWTATTGHVVIVKHAAGFTSIYKHNTSLHKEQGDLVKSGEVIASAGDTGELSTGPHLHFELWNEGYPVDPTKYIAFE